MCLFCRIINGEIPAFKVYEDNDVLAFLDISQETTGHTLVIPKKHVENIFELDEELASKMFSVVTKLAKLLKEKLGCVAINILNNSGELAGQSVMHFHIHLIPQYENEHFNFNHVPHEPNFEKLKQTQELILK